MMTIQRFNQEDFGATIGGNAMMIVEFFGAASDASGGFGPVFEKVAPNHPDVVFGRVDIAAEPELVARFGVDRMPTLMVFREGMLVWKCSEVIVLHTVFDKFVRDVKALDMGAVRRELEALETG